MDNNYEDFNDFNNLINDHLEKKYSSTLKNIHRLDSGVIEVMKEILLNEIKDNTEELILSTDIRAITILQGKIAGQRDIIKFLDNIKDIKNL